MKNSKTDCFDITGFDTRYCEDIERNYRQQNQPLDLIKRTKALADTELVYPKEDYDKEGYEELKEISLQLMVQVSGGPLNVLQDFFLPE